MADNIIAPGLGTVLATDEISGAHYSKSKISFGENGTAIDVTEDTPFPVADPAIVSAVEALLAAINAAAEGTQPVSAASLPLPVGAATAAAQASLLAAVDELEALIAKITPSSDPRAVVPHATDALPVVAKSLYVGGYGNVTLRAEGGSSDVTYYNVPDGTELHVRATHVRATTTATNIVAY